MPDEKPSRGPRRRRRWPALVLLVVLAVSGTLVWTQVLGSEAETAGPQACPAPPPSVPLADGTPGPVAGTVVGPEVVAAAAPLAPGSVQVRVFNASGERGAAAQVAAELVTVGFAPAPDVQFADDALYTDQNLQCAGQIRFGATGLSAARTLQLVAPCAELVQDARADAVVDLALGTAFGGVEPSPEATSVLAALAAADPAAPAPVDPELLAAASSPSC